MITIPVAQQKWVTYPGVPLTLALTLTLILTLTLTLQKWVSFPGLFAGGGTHLHPYVTPAIGISPSSVPGPTYAPHAWIFPTYATDLDPATAVL